MKSLKTVIKQKCKFRASTITSEFFNFYKRSFWEEDCNPLYISHNGVSSKNIITLLKEMKSLIVFLFSCIQYDEGAREREETRKLHFELKFRGRGPWDDSILDLTNSICTESFHIGMICPQVVYKCRFWDNSLKQSSHFINSLTRLTLL